MRGRTSPLAFIGGAWDLIWRGVWYSMTSIPIGIASCFNTNILGRRVHRVLHCINVLLLLCFPSGNFRLPSVGSRSSELNHQIDRSFFFFFFSTLFLYNTYVKTLNSHMLMSIRTKKAKKSLIRK